MAGNDGARVLIARMSAIGDTLLTLPVACALRRAYPSAYLAWVVEQTSAAFVQNHPALDETIVVPRGWLRSPREVWKLRRHLKSRQFDVSIDCQSLTKSAVACWLSGAPERIGLRGKYGAELSPWLNNHLIEPAHPHVTDRSLELLEPLGIDDPEIEWHTPVDDEAVGRMGDYVSSHQLEAGYAVVNPGATWDSKLWEMDRFAEVARHLASNHGLPTIVVWGSDREQHMARQIAELAPEAARVAPRSSLHELAALLLGARLLVSSDTGPLHLAVSVGTPVVGLYGPTRPEDCGPYGAQHIALQERYQDGTHRQRRRGDNWAMREIAPASVCAACDQIIGTAGVERAA